MILLICIKNQRLKKYILGFVKREIICREEKIKIMNKINFIQVPQMIPTNCGDAGFRRLWVNLHNFGIAHSNCALVLFFCFVAVASFVSFAWLLQFFVCFVFVFNLYLEFRMIKVNLSSE